MNLSIFNNNLFDAGTQFFNQLGIQLNSNTASALGANKLLKDNYKEKGIFQAIDEAYFLGLVDDSIFAGNTPLLNKEKISLKEAEDRLTAEYNGLMVFAVRLKDSYSPTRGEMAELTRAFNRVSKSVPVVLLLKYGGLLSFAASERTKYKQAWREGEKIGKISLLKDIKVAAAHTGHVKILDDLKVAPAVTDFKALYKQWQEVFNVQLLNKKFYQELFYWYLWAVKKVKFPQIRPKEDLIPDEAHQSESVIRLLTRLLFCWFMKEKQELISELLFDKEEVKKILPNFSLENRNSSVYYRAILQNLFFATLSVPIKSRKYIRESFQGKNKDYGNQYVYRYQGEFADAKENLKLFKNIPFLNGGLFECLDEAPENDNEKEIRLDGFSTKEKKQAFVPDYLFWDEHRGIDLSEELDNPRKKNETVHGIIDILNSYKFTIEENTPLEEEIALDPELLGKVFESLLAYYNPETKANARKQTGSFYTPREIVNYMVDESLFATFQQKMSDSGITENIEKRLRSLISYNETENPFTEKETDVIIQVLENLKVLDPACGSGAFPMGILHKLVWILRKIDLENKKWFESIIKRLPDYAQSEMRKKLEGEDWDYLRKLGIIQQSVYGVDIQPIAIQIAKLRFFISLLVDQDIKGNTDNNFGLQPLPNLDFKLVSANTLIGAPEQNQQNDGKLSFAQDEFFDNFNKLTGQYFGTYEPAEKKKLTKKIGKLVSSKVQEKLNEIQHLGTHTDERFSKHLAEKNKAIIEQNKNDAKLWESYNNLFKHESVGFFETKYFFPEVKEGFDIVIGNPPYFNISTISKDLYRYLAEHYKSIHTGYNDIVYYFIYLGIEFLNRNGCSALITSNYYLGNEYAKNLRKYLKGHISKIVNFKDHMVFDEASIHTCISLSYKEAKSTEMIFFEAVTDEKITSSDIEAQLRPFVINRNDLNDDWLIADKSASSIIAKLNKDSILLGDISTIEKGSTSGKNNVFTIPCEFAREKKFESELLRKNVKNSDIERYAIRNRGNYLIYVDNHTDIKNFPKIYSYLESYKDALKDRNEVANGLYPWYRLERPRDKTVFDAKVKIVVPYRAENNRFAYDNAQYFNDGGDIRAIIINDGKLNIKYVLALLNSELINWFYGFIGKPKGKVREYFNKPLSLIPIKKISSADQHSFIVLVDQILVAKKKDPKADTSALEKQIDDMVYALYGLTPEEIAIVETKK